jgi:hypothetical protein
MVESHMIRIGSTEDNEKIYDVIEILGYKRLSFLPNYFSRD